jgi:hypothetical protein
LRNGRVSFCLRAKTMLGASSLRWEAGGGRDGCGEALGEKVDIWDVA